MVELFIKSNFSPATSGILLGSKQELVPSERYSHTRQKWISPASLPLLPQTIVTIPRLLPPTKPCPGPGTVLWDKGQSHIKSVTSLLWTRGWGHVWRTPRKINCGSYEVIIRSTVLSFHLGWLSLSLSHSMWVIVTVSGLWQDTVREPCHTQPEVRLDIPHTSSFSVNEGWTRTGPWPCPPGTRDEHGMEGASLQHPIYQVWDTSFLGGNHRISEWFGVGETLKIT